jgi:hypothetical protein
MTRLATTRPEGEAPAPVLAMSSTTCASRIFVHINFTGISRGVTRARLTILKSMVFHQLRIATPHLVTAVQVESTKGAQLQKRWLRKLSLAL